MRCGYKIEWNLIIGGGPRRTQKQRASSDRSAAKKDV